MSVQERGLFSPDFYIADEKVDLKLSVQIPPLKVTYVVSVTKSNPELDYSIPIEIKFIYEVLFFFLR